MKRYYLLLIIMVTGGYSAVSQNLYTQVNAANPDNEANATTGWTGAASITSSATNPQNGIYALLVTSTGTGRDARYTFTAIVGTVYTITIHARRGATFNNPAFANWTGFSGFTTTAIGSQTWTQYNWILTATSINPVIVAYAAPIGAAAGPEIYIDNITITAPSGGDTQAPTAPAGLAASNTTSSSTTLTWNASTDNTGVTQYQIRRDNVLIGSVAGNTLTYNATGLTMSTTYSFNVVALDAANNVSQPSNTIQITTLAGSGEPYTTLNANLSTVNWQANDLFVSGNAGVGSPPNANYRLSVNGDVRAKEVVVETGWSDFVFHDDYYLKPLKEVEQFIINNGHLQDIPPASEVRKNGVGLAEINTRLLQKIEELTLYMIEINKQIELLEAARLTGTTGVTIPATTLSPESEPGNNHLDINGVNDSDINKHNKVAEIQK